MTNSVSLPRLEDEPTRCQACGSSRLATLLDNLQHVYARDGQSHGWPYRFLKCHLTHKGDFLAVWAKK